MRADLYPAIAFLIMVLATTILVPNILAEAQRPVETPGIGMSGSFYTIEGLRIPRGGAVNSSDVFIVVYSYYDAPLEVALNYSAPDGIRIVFRPNTTNFTLAPHESKRFNIAIIVDNMTVPGNYTIAVYAKAIYRTPGGPVKILPSVAQQASIMVTGEYGEVHVIVVDPAGKRVDNALIRLTQKFRGTTLSIADSYGELTARVVPGNYTIKAYIAGDLVGEKNITVYPGDYLDVKIEAKIIFIEYFDIQPILDDEGRLISTRIILNIKNVYKTIENATITLEVNRDNQPLEERQLVSSGILPIGRSQYQFDYVPSQGWKPGNYTFKVKIYGFGGKLLAESSEKWLYYHKKQFSLIFIILPIILAILIIVAVSRRKKRKPPNTTTVN